MHRHHYHQSFFRSPAQGLGLWVWGEVQVFKLPDYIELAKRWAGSGSKLFVVVVVAEASCNKEVFLEALK